jgi:DNA-binding SARP family transcriptional activator/predicted ATPase
MDQLQLSLLGYFQALVDGTAVADFSTDKIRALLAFLAVEANRPHRRDSLATLFWPDWDNAGARNNLRLSLHRLRQTLDAAAEGLSEGLLDATRDTVQVNKAALNLDVARFLDLLEACELHLHHLLHLCPSCLAQMSEAAALYGGELLAGLSLGDAPPFEQWQLVQREALGQQALALLYRLTDAFEQRGDYEQAQSYARQQLALDPLREEAQRQVMRLYALQGQRGEALAYYERCRQLLWDELGVEPDKETVSLQKQIQRGQLRADNRAARPLLHHFPAQFTPFLGREAEVEAVVAYLSEPATRLLTITAPGGMGKTRLAIAAAGKLADESEFTDGIYFVALAGVSSFNLLPSALAQSLGLNLAGQSEPEEQIIHHLYDKKMLILLDNVEHLLDGVEWLVRLLEEAPGLKLLVTSREALNVRAEQRLALEGLSEEAAVRLFIQAAQRSRPGFAPNAAEIEAIQAICHDVGAMPLAVELAATWVGAMDVTAIAGQIRYDIDFLATSQGELPERQRSMRVVFEQMWAGLAAIEQMALAGLSVFRGPFRLNAATAITQASPFILANLLDKSLLRQVGSSGRFELHELLRQFAAEQLETLDEGTAARRIRDQHSVYYLNYVREHGAALNSSSSKSALADLQRNLDNIRLAWRWAVANAQLERLEQAVPALVDFYRSVGLLHEGVETFAVAAVSLKGQIEAGLLPAAPTLAAIYELQQREATLLGLQGNYDRALITLEAVRTGWETVGDQKQLARTLGEMGYMRFQQRRLQEARQHLDESLALARAQNDKEQVAFALHHKGDTFLFEGEFTPGKQLLLESIALYRAVDNKRNLAGAINDLAMLHCYQGDQETGRALYLDSLALYETVNDHWGRTMALNNLGSLSFGMGRLDEAQRYGEQALTLAQEAGIRGILQYIMGNLGHVAFAQGEAQQAQRYYRESLQLAEETDEWDNGLEALSGLANLAARAEGQHHATRWLAAVAQERARTGMVEEAYILEWEQETIAALRAALGNEAFAALWAKGEELSLEAAAAEALSFAARAVYTI